jgi:hypothetical protein
MKIILEGSELVINKFLKVNKTYMKRKGINIVESNEIEIIVIDEEEENRNHLHDEYFKKFDKKVPKNKARDIDWIKEKLNG